jgi:hypothetical protein
LRSFIVLLFVTAAVTATTAQATPVFEDWQHAAQYSHQPARTTDYLLGLGALQKIGGRWRHKHSEDLTGELQSTTWQVADGYTAEEAFDWYRAQLPVAAELLFECRGRSCGSSAQWADRVFDERVLYGHDERQHYAVWRLQDQTTSWTLVLYAVDRANRRHFLRMDILQQTLVE